MVCNLTQVNKRSTDSSSSTMNPTTSSTKIVGTNMVKGDVVEGESVCPSQERLQVVDGRKSTAEERPLLVTVSGPSRSE